MEKFGKVLKMNDETKKWSQFWKAEKINLKVHVEQMNTGY